MGSLSNTEIETLAKKMNYMIGELRSLLANANEMKRNQQMIHSCL